MTLNFHTLASLLSHDIVLTMDDISNNTTVYFKCVESMLLNLRDYSLGNERQVLQGFIQSGLSQHQNGSCYRGGEGGGILVWNLLFLNLWRLIYTHLAIRGKSLRA